MGKNKSQFIKNIASISHNITGGRNYIPNTVDRLKSDLRAIGSRDVSTGSQNDLTALVRTVAAELDIYVNARFTMLHDQIISEFSKDADAAVKTSFCRDSIISLL